MCARARSWSRCCSRSCFCFCALLFIFVYFVLERELIVGAPITTPVNARPSVIAASNKMSCPSRAQVVFVPVLVSYSCRARACTQVVLAIRSYSGRTVLALVSCSGSGRDQDVLRSYPHSGRVRARVVLVLALRSSQVVLALSSRSGRTVLVLCSYCARTRVVLGLRSCSCSCRARACTQVVSGRARVCAQVVLRS